MYKAFDLIAGSSIGNIDLRSTLNDAIDELIHSYSIEGNSSPQCVTSWRYELACTNDDDLGMLADVIVDDLNDHMDMSDYCTIIWHDNEIIVMPYIDDEVVKLSDHPENMVSANIGTAQCFDALMLMAMTFHMSITLSMIMEMLISCSGTALSSLMFGQWFKQ